MGGNVFKNVAEVDRIPAAEYRQFNLRVREKLFETGLFDALFRVDSYRNKPDHGDLDIVVINPGCGIGTIAAKIKEVFNTEHVASSGDTISFLFRNHQVDLILCEDADVANFASCYFSWNDLGNFVERVAHRLGFKFGHDGLRYVIRDPENDARVVKEVVVTIDFAQALEFLGYDRHEWEFGFDNPEDIFRYACSSEYFDPAQFNLSNRSSEARRRDRTRKMYQDMLVFLNREYGLQGDEPKIPVDRQEHLRRAFEHFPYFGRRFDFAMECFRQEKAFKANFNGELFRDIFAIEGKQLGRVMEAYRKYINRFALEDWIATLDVSQARSLYCSLYDTIMGSVSVEAQTEGV